VPADLRTAEIPLGGALGARPGEAWLVRPDAYVAAVLPDPAAPKVATTLRRASGGTFTGKVPLWGHG
jgi:pentachlorophenol monooxygenase/3-(3-hydroxy-phenyl)propionate hydroxylase